MYSHSRRRGSIVLANPSPISTSSPRSAKALCGGEVGATAIHHGLTLVTNNTKHFQRIQGIRLEDWTQ